MKLRRDVIDLTGLKLGHLTVLRPGRRRHYPTTSSQLTWVVRCDCGREYEALGAHLRGYRGRMGVVRCKKCLGEYTAERNRRIKSVKLKSGKTVAQVAQAAGLKLDTVYHRYIRGWPEEALGKPLGVSRRKKPLGVDRYVRLQ